MQTISKSKSTRWALRDVLLLAFVAVFIGFIFWVLGPIYNLLSAALTPLGLAPFANEILLGGWMMAAPLASILIRQAGAGVLGEFFAAAVEMLLGGQWGVATLLSGLVQGIGNEAGFAVLGYKNWGWGGIFASAITGTIITFIWSAVRDGYGSYHIGMLIALFLTRFVSLLFFGGVLVVAIQKLIEKAGVLRRD
ncbi:ECF transporter S component [Leuconostoc rapi]|uniref:ECF transporter S component n=1 Tax=Leuconostoc rapi TaxID=1406906 RepID=UPI00195CA39E|nr:ECF transporter S component [Leuconostoc rapi]MBM7435362.1 energy-coupling factor transport system substrate-specific component [Leuconostoc rapi]